MGLESLLVHNPGLPRASPWAVLGCTFGATDALRSRAFEFGYFSAHISGHGFRRRPMFIEGPGTDSALHRRAMFALVIGEFRNSAW